MNLNRTVYQIQYQTAKLEVIESLFWHGRNDQPSSESVYNFISDLRQNLFNASEDCLDISLDVSAPYLNSLQVALTKTINLLTQMNNELDPTDSQIIFLKELFTDIVSELISLNAEFNDTALQSSQRSSDSRLVTASRFKDLSCQNFVANSGVPDSTDSSIDQLFRNLVTKCLGDSGRAERLIQYERRRHSNLDREEAIRAAIIRWENDNR